MTTGDFDRDGRVDLALGNAFGADVAVLLGNGDGTFRPEQRFGAGASPLGIAIADLNRDGAADLAVANTRSGNVTVLLSNRRSVP